MILPDVNILIYATDTASPFYQSCSLRLRQAFETDGVGFVWHSLLGFLRLTTRTGILKKPLQTEQALAVVEHWLAQPNAHLLNPTAAHLGIVARLLLGAGRAGLLVPDAHLAALSIEHQVVLLTFDRDFESFAGVKVDCLVG
jgi:uncharacterized protein